MKDEFGLDDDKCVVLTAEEIAHLDDLTPEYLLDKGTAVWGEEWRKQCMERLGLKYA